MQRLEESGIAESCPQRPPEELAEAQKALNAIEARITPRVKRSVETLRARQKVLEMQTSTLVLQLEELGLDAQSGIRAPVYLTAAPPSAEAEEVRAIQALIKDSPDLLNAPDSNGYTPLHHAAQAGQPVVAEFLLAHGANVETTTNDGLTPLHLAASHGHRSMVKLLLKHQASIREVDHNGYTPLHLAAQKGYRSVVETLLAAGRILRRKAMINPQHCCSPALMASSLLWSSLLAHSANLTATTYGIYDDNKYLYGTPLSVAALRVQSTLVKLLLSKGA